MSDDRIDTRDLVDELAAIDLDDEETDDIDRNRAAAILALFEEISGYAGDRPEDGVFLIAEDCFEEYAQELAEDIGAIPVGAGWPAYCIDWALAARDLAMDYTSVTFQGRDYYYQ